CQQYKDLLTF
nr:immunoglobulin light chain junction region [Macaca mulatta]MOX98144.1 immunoglobulin light chain junction region [Macaca mulatta]